MRAIDSFLFALLATACSVEAFSPTNQPRASRASTTAISASRREAIERFGAAAAFSACTVLIAGGAPAQAEEETSELIQVLKARSEANREANENYAKRSDKLSKRDFRDMKTRKPSFVSVKIPSTGSVKLMASEEFATMQADGKIKTEYGVRMKQGGGEMVDYANVSYVLVE